ncbi:uncharacterized protein yc1106_01611 [Curvularia clavata]|uniref:Uncharacterized protein n=1 Tax=Curvularia clavata TaxID=95742 RepID=A0A9Q8Z1F8_CURCL|nr:uncharacterized protein yc1106_01611 [Curvularia clavata]
MHITSKTNAIIALSLASVASTTPLPLTARTTILSSSRNIYLTTCTTRSLTSDATSSSAILYSGTPANTAPVAIGTVSSARAIQWAGFTRRVTLDGTGVFESRIDRGADAFPKSELSGGATLESSSGSKEEFVCFRDGETTFSANGLDADVGSDFEQ